MAFLPPFVPTLNQFPRRTCVAHRPRYHSTPTLCATQTDSDSDPVDAKPENDDSQNASAEPIEALQSVLNEAFNLAFNPALSTCSVLQRRWTTLSDSYILRPSGQAKAVIHFIGGAFFGATPHIAYRTLLERLANRGYCVVAAPYNLSLDYLSLVATLTSNWERIETDLALEYGAVPVIGLGHSAGALFHAIASSLFDDTCPKAANILISFNNRTIRSAIPLYDQLTPLLQTSLSARDSIPDNLRTFLDDFPDLMDATIEGSPLTPNNLRKNLLPTLRESRRAADQLLPLFREIANDSEENDGEFYPPPPDVQRSISELYAVEQTLVVKFRGDTLDDSPELVDAIRKRGADTEVSLITVGGSHLTPLAQDAPDFTAVFDDAPETLGVFGARSASVAGSVASAAAAMAQETVNALGLKELTALEVLIDEWIEAGIANDKL